jgi:hypothetical protein
MCKSNYLQEFPNFGELDVTLPEGFHDVSYHHDTMPSFTRQRWPERDFVTLWVDYADEARREIPGHPRFLLLLTTPGTDTTDETIVALLHTDDWPNMLAAVAKYFPNPKYWAGATPKACQLCDTPLAETMVDGATTYGGWALLCHGCHVAYGCGLGQGYGQRYELQASGKWLKTAG